VLFETCEDLLEREGRFGWRVVRRVRVGFMRSWGLWLWGAWCLVGGKAREGEEARGILVRGMVWRPVGYVRSGERNEDGER
jgi:hypothetical protein